jgi:tetratricopeptide (TPR) repeat protein
MRLRVLLIACGASCACGTTSDVPKVEDRAPVERPAPAGDMQERPSIGADDDAAASVEPAEGGTDLESLRQAVERDAGDAQAHRRLGLALRRSGQHDEGLRHLARAAELAPRDADLLLTLGIAYSAEHRLAEAESTYRKVLEIEPQHPKALNNLGNVAMRAGDEEAAIAWYRRAVEADPAYFTALHQLADLLKYHGRFDEAYPLYERILGLAPSNPRERIAMVESLYGMGSINLARNRHELAEQQLAQVLSNIPNHRSAHWARAQALLGLGREAEAQEELARHLGVLHAMGEGF